MSRKAASVAPRRHSVPVPSNLPNEPIGAQGRSFPEGTETFQKALEDLYVSDSTQPYVHYRHDGLKQIQEGDEDELSDSERAETRSNGSPKTLTPRFLAPMPVDRRRRHSMPASLLSEDLEKFREAKAAKEKSAKNIVKEHSNYMKEYFVKHGHWPSASSAPHKHAIRNVSKDMNRNASQKVTTNKN